MVALWFIYIRSELGTDAARDFEELMNTSMLGAIDLES